MSSEGQTFGEVVSRLDEIVEAVRSKDASLEHSLDLLDEAIALGSRAVDLVDSAQFTPEELARIDASAPADASDAGTPNQGDAKAPTAGGALATATDDAPAAAADEGVA